MASHFTEPSGTIGEHWSPLNTNISYNSRTSHPPAGPGEAPDRPGRLTIGVFSNKQIYEGTTIARFEHVLLHGIREAARAYDCNLLLACGVGPGTVPLELIPAWPLWLPNTNFVPVGPWNTSGLIAIPPFTDDQERTIQQFLPAGHPVVFTYPQRGYPSVAPANSEGISQAFAHLIGHGHRRIAYVAQDPQAGGDSAERLAAYRAAMSAHGLACDSALVGYGGHNAHESYLAIKSMLDAGVDFTAVLTSNDYSAIGVMRALADAGRCVPQDVAVIGFDDVLSAKAQTPPLTTVRHPTFALGYRAVEVLLDYIAGRRIEVEIFRVPTQLIVRESCGCWPYDTPHLNAEDEGRRLGVSALDMLVEKVASAVSAEAGHGSEVLIDAGCRSLVEAFLASLEQEDARVLAAALDRILHEVEATEDGVFPWQAAISVISEHLEVLVAVGDTGGPLDAARNLIDQARVQISERLRRWHTIFRLQQDELTARLGTMTTQLLTALEPQQILDILADHLPQIGIQHADIAFFEAEDEDPVAWSNVYVRSESSPQVSADLRIHHWDSRRFPSRQFPPPWLYSSDEPFSLALLPLIIDGGPSGFVAFDTAYLEPCGLIVRYLAAGFRNSQLHTAAEEGRRLAEEANRLKSRFLSTVSHELRTPLNLIVGLSEMLLRNHSIHSRSATFPFDAGMQDIERIYANAQHLGHLIGDVLDLASSGAGQLRLYSEPLDLVEMLQPVIATGERMALEKGLEWRAKLPAAGPWVRGDRTRLRQVALNLISNAVRFTEHGAITVEICVTGEAVTVMVSDTGPGVPLADQQKIFDEFRMSERTADRAYGGLGLGLTICKQLIEQHGGTIGVRSSGEEDAGATFFFTLSLILPDDGGRRTKDGDAEGGRQKAEELNSQSHFTTYPRRVVFLTEGEHSGGPLSTALRELGFDAQVQRIDSGVDWLPVLSTAAPGVLVLDEHLATSRGWEIIRLLKGHPRLAHLPLLMYSLDSSHDNGTLLALDYLLKPLDIEQLVTALERQRDYHDRPPDDRTILVVDDNPDILAMHTRLIKQQMPECRLVQARNGVEALAIMSEQRPNLVLLDLMMPEMDGFHVLEAMREQESLVDVPVVVLTARLLTEDDMTRLNAGVAAILSKGLFGTDEILARIESTLAHERRLGLASQQIVRRAVAFIHTHYDEPMTRDQIATHVGFSPDHLTACFRQEMGVTPISYLNRYRISRARTLLTESTRSVTDITVAVGFSDVANFSRAFRREVGVSPKAYRRDRQQ